jgi:glycosyltransferase involved in cell wall biosynthesis
MIESHSERSEIAGKPLTLGYMTSLYARASDWFIRGEVAQLRAMGHTVHTFSIRKADPKEAVSPDVAREQAGTICLVETGIATLALALARRTFRSPGKVLEAVKLALKFATPGLKGRIWPWAYLLEAAYLADLLEARGVEHLHNHIAENSASVAALASVLSCVPFSMTVHGPNEFDSPRSFAYGEKIHRSAFTAAISEYGRSQLFRWCDYHDWPKVRVIRSGVRQVFLDHELTPVPEARRLICVGRLAEQKGQLLLVEAAARLAEEGLEFEVVLIGDGEMRGPIETLISRFGLESRVRIAGWMGSDEVVQEILKSRGMLLPSFAEGLPMVLIESLALGRPVVSTYVGGVPELVEAGVSGWLVPAGSIAPLVDAMRAILTASPDVLAEMGRAGAEKVAGQHNLGQEVAKLSALFQRSVEASGRSQASLSSIPTGQGRNALSAAPAGSSHP